MVTVESQCAKAKVNHRAWLEVNHCLEQVETVQESLQKHREGLVTSSPDPLTLCIGNNGAAELDFDGDNARVFPCISEVVSWCDPSPTSASGPCDEPSAIPSSTSKPIPPCASKPISGLASAGRVQILVTGSLHLVGAAMSVLGCKVEDL